MEREEKATCVAFGGDRTPERCYVRRHNREVVARPFITTGDERVEADPRPPSHEVETKTVSNFCFSWYTLSIDTDS